MSTKSTTRTRRTHEQMIADLQAKIASIKTRAARRSVKADPALRHTSAAVKSIDKALAETKDAATRQALSEARSTLSACLSLNGVTPSSSGAVLKPAARRSSGENDNLPETLLAYVRSNPGQRGEQIAAALGTDTKAMRPSMKKLIGEGRVKTRGERRGMTYSAT